MAEALVTEHSGFFAGGLAANAIDKKTIGRRILIIRPHLISEGILVGQKNVVITRLATRS